jgi:hypothetical protein
VGLGFVNQTVQPCAHHGGWVVVVKLDHQNKGDTKRPPERKRYKYES